jgi:hypothetical protein
MSFMGQSRACSEHLRSTVLARWQEENRRRSSRLMQVLVPVFLTLQNDSSPQNSGSHWSLQNVLAVVELGTVV